MSSIVANNYASALFDLAREHDAVEQVRDDLVIVDAALCEPSVRTFFQARTVDVAEKKKLITNIFEGNVHRYLYITLMLLADAERLSIIDDVRAAYLSHYHRYKGINEAHVISAFELAERERAEIVSSLEKKFNCGITATFDVRPALIGGVLVEIDGRQLDFSVLGQLAALRDTMMKKSIEPRNYYEN
ncbi:MAG: ATP synthase F1 subunit delta [Spirochaetota bacterium]